MNQNLHLFIKTHFGKDCLSLVREFEKTSRKLADYRNHLRFNLRCLHSDIIPRSLWIKSPVKGFRAYTIVHKAEKALINERVRQTTFTISVLHGELDSLKKRLAESLPQETYERVLKFTENAQLVQHERSKSRQINKFARLVDKKTRSFSADKDQNWRNRKSNDVFLDKCDVWVKNLSDKQLNNAEKSVLSRGLNFAVAPESIPYVDYITATESAIRNNRLNPDLAEEIRGKVTVSLSNAKPPPPNLSAEERRAAHSLAKDQDIIILPADKGRCTVVLNKTDYDNKVRLLLNDSDTYEPLKRDPSSNFKKKVIGVLQQLEKGGFIDKSTYYSLYPGDDIPAFYGLPKIHKEDIPLRPIVSSINSVTYNIAKYLTSVLSPLVGLSERNVLNSKDFIEKVQDIKVEGDECIASFDVSALFTSVPPDQAVDVARKRLVNDPNLGSRTKLSPDQLCQLLELCLSTTYFIFDGKFYKQKHGCAMGSPISPVLANLYMEEFEDVALNSFTGTPPTHWFRYVDDTWVKIKSTELDSFFDHINNCDKFIKFTVEKVKDRKLAFLDCVQDRT